MTLTRTALLPSPVGEVTRLADTLVDERPFSVATALAAEVIEPVVALAL